MSRRAPTQNLLTLATSQSSVHILYIIIIILLHYYIIVIHITHIIYIICAARVLSLKWENVVAESAMDEEGAKEAVSLPQLWGKPQKIYILRAFIPHPGR